MQEHARTDAFRGARFRDCDLTGVRITSCAVDGLRVDGFDGSAGHVVVDGVDVGAYVSAELDRRHPERVQLRAVRTADDHRAMWATVERLWVGTVARAEALPEAARHERVDGEWSVTETLRHLVFAVEVWIDRVVLGGDAPHHPLALPPTDMADEAAALGLDVAARPPFAEVVALHDRSRARVRGVLADVTDARLAEVRTAVFGPAEESHTVGACMLVVAHEHCAHHRFAERDLIVLAAGLPPASTGKTGRVILGYPDDPTARAGGRLVLRVSTDAPAFCILVYRCGDGLEPVAVTGWLPGEAAPRGAPHEDWGWPGHVVEIPSTWRPGVHLAVLVEGDGGRLPDVEAPPAYADAGQVLFVVRGRPAPILYKLPLFTWHAYNTAVPADGWSLYNLPDTGPREVSVLRPGGGTGGSPFDVFNRDPFDPTPRQTFVHWDAPLIAWLERHGYDLDFCTDLDLHRDPALLAHRPLLLSAGHDEYWSEAMRDRAEAHVAAGGNIAFLGGNTCWWRIAFDGEHAFRRDGNWWEHGRPENHLTGVSFRHGGERHADHFPVRVGYRVQHADHWVFEGTGLRDGDVVGEREYVVGYEADGAHFDRSAGYPARPTGDDGTPPGFTILGVGDIAPSGWGNGNSAATMGLFTRGGTVFTGATVDWPRVVAGGTSPALERITHNLLQRLRRS